MLIATWSQAGQGLFVLALAYAALAAAFIALGRFARRNWRRGEVPQAVLARLTQLVLCGFGVAGVPILLLMVWAIGCPPDAYECPV